jgi:hypothetical protein
MSGFEFFDDSTHYISDTLKYKNPMKTRVFMFFGLRLLACISHNKHLLGRYRLR